MKRLIFVFMMTSLTGIFAVNILGQTTPHADKRQKIQKHRIKTGAKSGEITKREGKSVKRSYTKTKKYETKAKSDGKVTWKERARLQHMENKSSRKIFRTKHNKRDRN